MAMRTTSLDRLADQTISRSRSRGAARFIVGIAGPPAAGKSTLAGGLRDAINEHESVEVAVVAPMDGFHLANDRLKEEGWLHEKGQPHTFDVTSFLDHLRALRDTALFAEIQWPEYDRKLHDPVPGPVIYRQHQFVIVEGNYLLLDWPGWAEVRGLLDEVWYVDVEPDVAERRLYERHLRSGRTPEEARRKVAESDLPNLELIVLGKMLADRIVVADGGMFLTDDPA
ncbi:nucleoside/nucleotide kinase family protein [Nocardia tengchongensis]|uniref:nucleoside triphosphate hydrolase n=1 Tax=Nocardia tengchongensis TaxID=2055889 RepID=UPI00365BE6FB